MRYIEAIIPRCSMAARDHLALSEALEGAYKTYLAY